MRRVMFKAPTTFASKGRNGFVTTTGVNLTRVGRTGENDDTVWFEPVTSKGVVSEACRLVIAFSSVDEVIDALQAIKQEEGSP